MLMHKEGWSRLGYFGYDLQDQCGSANSLAMAADRGLMGELCGPNYPNYAMNVGHQGEYAAIVSGAIREFMPAGERSLVIPAR
ncbi:hypothetical protein JCM10550A_24260 [Methanogenium cariaci]|jgi:methyl-coenzyme M reductase alpha subunit